MGMSTAFPGMPAGGECDDKSDGNYDSAMRQWQTAVQQMMEARRWAGRRWRWGVDARHIARALQSAAKPQTRKSR